MSLASRGSGSGRYLITPAIVALALALALGSSPTAAQQRSGSTVLTFLDAVDRGDLDTALFYVLNDVEVTTLDGAVLIGKDEVRPFLADFPKPIEIREHHHLRRMGYEARITAGDTPMKLTFRGARGIAAILLEPDPPVAQPDDADE